MNGECQQEVSRFFRNWRVSRRHNRPGRLNHSLTFHSVVAHSLQHINRQAGCERRASGLSVMSDGQTVSKQIPSPAAAGPEEQEMHELSPGDLSSSLSPDRRDPHVSIAATPSSFS
jgi:hypothetical protein